MITSRTRIKMDCKNENLIFEMFLDLPAHPRKEFFQMVKCFGMKM